MPRAQSAAKVTRQLEELMRGRERSKIDIITRYQQCEDWQRATAMFDRAISARGGAKQLLLAAPPGWLPLL